MALREVERKSESLIETRSAESTSVRVHVGEEERKSESLIETGIRRRGCGGTSLRAKRSGEVSCALKLSPCPVCWLPRNAKSGEVSRSLKLIDDMVERQVERSAKRSGEVSRSLKLHVRLEPY